MIIDSKYAKQFVSNDLACQKYDELYDFAVSIRHADVIVEKTEFDKYSNKKSYI